MEALQLLLSPGAGVGGEDCVAGEGPGLLLLGEPGSGKTALLFAAALVAAGEGRGPVLFVARRALQSLPPGWKAGAARDPLRLQKIHFLYPPSLRELLQLLSSMHETTAQPPSLLLLDGLHEYLAEASGPQAWAHLAALLVDTVAYFSGCLSRDCGLLVTMRSPTEAETEAAALQLAVLQRYLPKCLWLGPEPPDLAKARPRDSGHCFRARLSTGPGCPRQEWCLSFGHDGKMAISPVPCQAAEHPSQKPETSSSS
ncbi:ATPase SWSAP1 [Antechinus flavipes]|uniref:ATPase SWSAP1 n=1 Tax=Antechinus flavipes TaxID=38775 RepID=UPI002235942F|nr:ATPase SWSAP1 [Antechinus flavipes]